MTGDRPPRGSLTERRIARTRLDIAVSALELERERGWEQLTVADIAAAAGVSLRTFHRYFSRRSDVFMPLLEEATERLQRIFVEIDSDDLPYRAAHALERSFDDFPGGAEAAHHSYRTLLTDPSLTSVWLLASANAEPGFADVLRRCFPQLDDEHEGRLLSAVIVTCQRIALQDWVAGPASRPLGPIVERAVRHGLDLS